MRKLFIMMFLLGISLNMSAISIACCFDGYWSEWQDCGNSCKIKGGYSGFIFYSSSDGPWNYLFKFTIDNFRMPEAKQRKKDAKNGVWYEYTGTVEYYICDDYPTMYSVFKEAKKPKFVPKDRADGRPTKKVTSKATIKIAAFKDRPNTYNIWFDNVGVAFSDISF